MKRELMLLIIMLVAATGCSTGGGLEPIGSANPTPYRLGPGDEIRITISDLAELTNTYLVSDTGTISMPRLGTVQVDGKTLTEVETALADSLRAKQVLRDPSVSVQIEKYRPFFIMGQVQRPGQYPYVPGMSVLKAVSIAGGYTFRAETGHVAITRNVGDRRVKGRAQEDTPVLPGDTIYVYEGWF